MLNCKYSHANLNELEDKSISFIYLNYSFMSSETKGIWRDCGDERVKLQFLGPYTPHRWDSENF